jgi:serine O-acetyltransferase
MTTAAAHAVPESAWSEFVGAVRADHATIARYAAKYPSPGHGSSSLGADLVRKVGFQMMAAYRLMRLLRRAGAPLLAQGVSRIVRILYGADIHWDAELEPGVMIVHGMGLCLSHSARVGSGSILFQNVTLGEGIDPDTRQVGAPRVEADVHIGPGATLVGPITIGSGTKITAGCFLTHSVPAASIVEAPAPVVRPRSVVA